MARTAGQAPSTGQRGLQIGLRGRAERLNARVERWLEVERDQLILWLPVMTGTGVVLWFALPHAAAWSAVILIGCALGVGALMLPRCGRAMRALGVGALALAFGCALIWFRAERVAEPVLARPVVANFTGTVERVEALPARAMVRLRIAPIDAPDLPPTVRVNVAEGAMVDGIASGAVLRLRARLMAPAPPAVPGAYDFERVAWFDGLGATGRAFGEIEVLSPADQPGGTMRAHLSAHVRERVGGSAGAIAATLATGDRGAISEEDAEAMRRSGLAHLLSISGLHVTAVVGAAMVVTLRLLALFPALALRFRLPVLAAGAGAVAAVGYTWLTGAEVPTVRSCIAALLVLTALVIGREALTLRLVATGAFVVLLMWPESLLGPSFQMSFAAVTAIIALNEHPRMRALVMRRDEDWVRKIGRGLLALFLTSLAVEIVLTPIAMYHFHKAGIYGVIANLVAIPLTTFVIMPLEALALLLDVAGLGAPLWWLVGVNLDFLIWIAHTTANTPGSIALIPGMPAEAYAIMVAGGLWIALWKGAHRKWGVVPVLVGAIWTLATPEPDLLVTGDGRHLALRSPEGGMALLRDRAGDYVRSTLGENAGWDGELGALSALPGAACSPDICIADYRRGDRVWRIAATRSSYYLDIADMARVCREADIVVSERRLPRTCNPRWLKLDRWTLRETGGVAISFAGPRVTTVRRGTDHPWLNPPKVAPPWRERRGSAESQPTGDDRTSDNGGSE